MGAETRISVTLPAAMVADLKAAVADGQYATLDEAVAAAVDRRWVEDFEQGIGRERLAALLQEGADSGPSVDGEAVFARLIAKYEAMAAERG